jgi:hypothetical protein
VNIKEAQTAIAAILEAIPDDELPEFDRVEHRDDGTVIVWWGSHGSHLGSSMSGGVRDPLAYRRRGAWAAIEAEMTHRADRRLLDNGDDPTGVRLGRKVVAR